MPQAELPIALTPAELRITRAALRSFLNDFGHDERDVHELVKLVLAKLPDEAQISAAERDDEQTTPA